MTPRTETVAVSPVITGPVADTLVRSLHLDRPRGLNAQLQAAREAHQPAAPSPTVTRFDVGDVVRIGVRNEGFMPLTDSDTTQRIPLDQLPTSAAA